MKRKRYQWLLSLVMLGALGAIPALAQTWNGSTSNQWNDATNWTPNTVPNSSTANAVINSTTNNPVIISGINPTVDMLTLGSVNSLNVANGQTLNIAANGSISNAGAITLSGAGSGDYLYVGNGGTTTLNGTGTLTLANSAHNGATAIYGDGGVVFENVSNTIQGEGQIGLGRNLQLQNDSAGIVNANVAGQTLTLNGGTTTNTGILEATNGGQLQLQNDVTNVGGTIQTDSTMGSVVTLTGSHTITGGTLNGNVQIMGSGTLDGTTNTINNKGTVTVVNGSQANILGAINNTGSIVLSGAGSGDYFYAGNGNTVTTTLTGGGTVSLVNTAHNGATLIYGDGGATLDNVNNTISGEGAIGDGHNLNLVNEANGIINANQSGQLLILNGSAVTNKGILEATNGGTLRIDNLTVANGGANIQTDSGNSSLVLLNGATIQGGTLTGTFQAQSNSLLDGSTTQGAVTNAGTMTVLNGQQLQILGTINNTGSIVLNGSGSGDYLYAGNGNFTTTLTGGGTVSLVNTAHNGATLIYGDGGVTLDNKNNTISGEGYIGDGHNMYLLNEAGGIVNANQSGQLLVLDGNTVTNQGILEATNGGTLRIDNTVVNGGANIQTDSGKGSVVLLNNATIQGGTLTGTFQAQNNSLLDGRTSSQGMLTNAGTMTVPNGQQLQILGTINNTGSIVLNGAGSADYLYAGNGTFTTTLTGGGTVSLVNTAHNGNTLIYGDGGVTLENVNNTISGEGPIGASHNIILQNDVAGLVNANVSGQTLDLNGAHVINAGTLEATKGGVLEIDTTIQNNPNSTLTGGLITTDSGHGSSILLNGGTIQGGTVNGAVITQSSATLDGATEGVLHNEGSITNPNGQVLYIGGTINNTGSITLNGAGSADYLYVGNGNVTTTLTGNGTVSLVNTAHNGNTLIFGDGGATLDNQGNTIQGEGEIGAGHNMNFVNDTGGTVLANVNGQTLNINGSLATNNGTFKAANGGTLLVSSAFTNFSGTTLSGGSYVINGTAAASTLQINALGNTGGEIHTIGAGTTLTLDGTNANVSFVDAAGKKALTNLTTNQGNINLEGGYNGNVIGEANNSGNVLIDSASSLTSTGNYVQTAGITQVDGTLTAPLVNIGGGILQGGGTISASGGVIIQSGAAIEAGDTLAVPVDPPATMDILGPLDLNGGSTVNELISGPSLADIGLIDVTGDVNLGGSVGVDTMLLNGFDPTSASQFIFLNYTGTLNAQNFFVTDPAIDPNGVFGIGYGAHDVFLTFTPNTSPVPEPASFLPLAGLLAGLGYGIRRKKQAKQAA